MSDVRCLDVDVEMSMSKCRDVETSMSRCRDVDVRYSHADEVGGFLWVLWDGADDGSQEFVPQQQGVDRALWAQGPWPQAQSGP